MSIVFNPFTSNLDFVGAGSSGANTALSNLTPTAINQSLIPDTDSTYDLGDGTSPLRWSTVYTDSISAGAAGTLNIPLGSNIDIHGNEVLNAADPLAPQSLATKNYVDTSAANTALSNLITTNINQDLTGNTGSIWVIKTNDDIVVTQNLLIRTGSAVNTGVSGDVIIQSGFSQSNDSGVVTVTTGQTGDSTTSGNTVIRTGLTGAGTQGDTGDLLLTTGEIFFASNTLGTTGDIRIFPGDPNTSGIRGKIKIQPTPIATTIGYVITATSTDGAVAWMPGGGSGASTALDNLTPTAINQSLLPDTDSSYDLGDGTSPLRWNNVATNNIWAGTSGDLFLNNGSSGHIDASSHLIKNGVDPVSAQDLATKNYVDTFASGANVHLSNLSGVAINADLFGDTGTAWTISTKDDTVATQPVIFRSGGAVSSGDSAFVTVQSGFSQTGNSGQATVSTGQTNANSSTSGPTLISTGLTAATSSGNTGNLTLSTGDIFSGGNTGGTTGNIIIVPGDPNNGTRGKIKIQPTPTTTTGYILTATNTDGSVDWTAPGAASDLGNLTLTSINQSLIPNADGVFDLGTSADRWTTIYVSTVSPGTGNLSLVGNGLVTVNNSLVSDVLDPVSPQDATTKIYVDGLVGINKKELFTLSGTDITNQYIDLLNVAKTDSIDFLVKGGGVQIEGASYDYSVSYTGGAGSKTRITFLNDLATGGASALVASDIIVVKYEY